MGNILHKYSLSITFTFIVLFSNLTNWQINSSINGFKVFMILFVLFVALTLIDLRRFYSFEKNQSIFVPLLLFFVWWFSRSLTSLSNPKFYNTELWQWIILFILFTNYISGNIRIGHMALFGYLLSAIVILILYYSGSNTWYERGRLTIFELSNPNTIGMISSNAILIVIYFISNDILRLGKMKYLLLLVLPGLFDITVKTGSRGAFICLAFGIACFVLFSKISLTKKITIGVILLFISIITISYLISSDIFRSRWIDDDVLRLGGRNLLWLGSIKLFFEKPIIGYGDGGFQEAAWIYFSTYVDPHNLYLVILVTSGLIGFIIFMFFLYRIFRLTLQNLRIKEDVICFIFLFVNLLAFFKAGSALNSMSTWINLAIIVGLSTAINNESSNNEPLNNNSLEDISNK